MKNVIVATIMSVFAVTAFAADAKKEAPKAEAKKEASKPAEKKDAAKK